MTSAVLFEEGHYGMRAVLVSAWSDAVEIRILEHACAEIEINQAKGWEGSDLLFLKKFPNLKSLKIIDLRIPSVEPIHALHELRALEVITYCKTGIYFESFPLLEDCGLEWRLGAESLFGCLKLQKLFINGYTGKNATPFANLRSLKSLAILNGPIQDITALSALVDLHDLRLGNLRKLTSLAGIESLENLKELEIHTCPGISSIEELSRLRLLRKLYLNNDGAIASLKPLNKLENLESVMFYESTNILDGDLWPLLRQTKLSNVAFKNRKHYSHKREEFGSVYYGL